MSVRASYDNPEHQAPARADEQSQQLLRSETSRKFHDLMDAAMLVSFFKYGLVADGFPEKVNAISSLYDRLKKYEATGNAEFLVDAANFAMIEFMHPAHANAHFRSTDSSESPGRRAANVAIYDTPVPYKNGDLADIHERPF